MRGRQVEFAIQQSITARTLEQISASAHRPACSAGCRVQLLINHRLAWRRSSRSAARSSPMLMRAHTHRRPVADCRGGSSPGTTGLQGRDDRKTVRVTPVVDTSLNSAGTARSATGNACGLVRTGHDCGRCWRSAVEHAAAGGRSEAPARRGPARSRVDVHFREAEGHAGKRVGRIQCQRLPEVRPARVNDGNSPLSWYLAISRNARAA